VKDAAHTSTTGRLRVRRSFHMRARYFELWILCEGSMRSF